MPSFEENKASLFESVRNIRDLDQSYLLNEILIEMLLNPTAFQYNEHLKDHYADRIGPQVLNIITIVALLMARSALLQAQKPDKDDDNDDDDPLGFGNIMDRMK